VGVVIVSVGNAFLKRQVQVSWFFARTVAVKYSGVYTVGKISFPFLT